MPRCATSWQRPGTAGCRIVERSHERARAGRRHHTAPARLPVSRPRQATSPAIFPLVPLPCFVTLPGSSTRLALCDMQPRADREPPPITYRWPSGVYGGFPPDLHASPAPCYCARAYNTRPRACHTCLHTFAAPLSPLSHTHAYASIYVAVPEHAQHVACPPPDAHLPAHTWPLIATAAAHWQPYTLIRQFHSYAYFPPAGLPAVCVVNGPICAYDFCNEGKLSN